MKLSDFDYELPQELIAQYPLKERDASRMMVLDRAQNKIYKKGFQDIVGYFSEGDAIVLNDARVIPARLIGKKETGASIEMFLLEKVKDDIYKVLAKPSKRLKEGTKVMFGKALEATVLENADFGKLVKFSCEGDLEGEMKKIGQVPLPPYIKRKPEESDMEKYQTVYARTDGATASPTAGLHFTDEILNTIREKGVNIAYVTLNVSYGTFAPVLEEEIERHKMHKEYFKLPKETAEMVAQTKARGNKIIAVGTTATRVLEACADCCRGTARRAPTEGWTDLFIYPGYKFRVVDMLLTNFHVPKSTLLMLVSAFAGRPACPKDTEAGREFILEAYRQAILSKFRFFSYGDCMLII